MINFMLFFTDEYLVNIPVHVYVRLKISVCVCIATIYVNMQVLFLPEYCIQYSLWSYFMASKLSS